MNENHLHKDLPRGTKLKADGLLAAARFEDPDAIRTTESLTYRKGMLFLGLIDAQIGEERNPQTGRLSRYATGGHAVGIDDDRHGERHKVGGRRQQINNFCEGEAN